MRKSLSAALLTVLTAALLAGCSRPLPVGALDSIPVSQAVLIGNGQVAPAGSDLPRPIMVRVLDDSGEPIEGQIVNFVVTSGGGAVFSGAAVSDERGLARDWWTLGPRPGMNRIEARAVDSTTGEQLVFGTFVALGR